MLYFGLSSKYNFEKKWKKKRRKERKRSQGDVGTWCHHAAGMRWGGSKEQQPTPSFQSLLYSKGRLLLPFPQDGPASGSHSCVDITHLALPPYTLPLLSTASSPVFPFPARFYPLPAVLYSHRSPAPLPRADKLQIPPSPSVFSRNSTPVSPW